MKFYVAAIDRDTREQDFLKEFRSYEKAVKYLIEKSPYYDDDDIVMATADSKKNFADLCPDFMGKEYARQYIRKVLSGNLNEGEEDAKIS